MAGHNELGQTGENKAVLYLRKQGYTILERNYRCPPAEVDIICSKEDEWIFVEVKSRSQNTFEVENWGLSKPQMQRIINSAYEYMARHNWQGSFRFDIITIAFSAEGAYDLQHYVDAFFPGLHGI